MPKAELKVFNLRIKKGEIGLHEEDAASKVQLNFNKAQSSENKARIKDQLKRYGSSSKHPQDSRGLPTLHLSGEGADHLAS